MNVRDIDAVYYTVTNLERSTAFYAELLGVPPTAAAHGYYSEWTFPGGTSFGLYASAGYTGGQSGSVMFAVDDVAAAMAECKARGITFDDDAVTETAVCYMAFGRDPDRNQFILHRHK
ncbi:MAG: VOC family protein [bacterium]|nr:VOC family protein [bacterium]